MRGARVSALARESAACRLRPMFMHEAILGDAFPAAAASRSPRQARSARRLNALARVDVRSWPFRTDIAQRANVGFRATSEVARAIQGREAEVDGGTEARKRRARACKIFTLLH
jgi:hypothetical protein